MKRILLISAFGLSFIFGLSAQNKDSLLRRQLELEREYNPTVMDANKLSSIPTLREPVVKKANTSYSTWAGHVNPPLEIAVPKPSTIMTSIPFSTQKGYAMLHAGNYGNINGALGYHFLDTEKDKLHFLFLHNSAKGTVAYLQEPFQNTQAYFMDNMGQLGYSHLFENFKLGLKAGYSHSLFNYYGNTFRNVFELDGKNQQVGVFNMKADVASVQSDWFNYRGEIDFKNFRAKYGESLSQKGISGNHLFAKFEMDKPLGSGKNSVGIEGAYKSIFHAKNEVLHNFNLLNASPFVYFEGFNWKTRLGVDVLFQFVEKMRIRVVPNVELAYNVTEKSSLYANIKGGIDDNTYLNMLSESRYVAPTYVKSSCTLVDVMGGVKIGEMDGFRFDIFGGYKHTNDAHFLLLQDEMSGVDTWNTRGWLVPMYANLSHAHAGGMFQMNIGSSLLITAKGQKNFYTVANATYNNVSVLDAKAYNLPSWEATINADVAASSKLKFSLAYYFAIDRWSYFHGQNVKMRDINDLNIGTTYQLNKAISFQLKANNVLFHKYDWWYGHPAQGLTVMGGLTFKF